MSAVTTAQAVAVARRYFNPQDADWNVLAALARDGEVTPQTYRALSDFHGEAHGTDPMTCESALAGHLCDLLALREWLRSRRGTAEVGQPLAGSARGRRR